VKWKTKREDYEDKNKKGIIFLNINEKQIKKIRFFYLENRTAQQ
jgi:hypothetical protein